jgi:hypothetical protein
MTQLHSICACLCALQYAGVLLCYDLHGGSFLSDGCEVGKLTVLEQRPTPCGLHHFRLVHVTFILFY